MGSKSKVKKITDGVPVQVWFPKQVHEQIRSRAQTEQRSVPGTIRLVVEEWLEAKQRPSRSRRSHDHREDELLVLQPLRQRVVQPAPRGRLRLPGLRRQGRRLSRVLRERDRQAERINGLLENIRQANLREDIDLFLSCYVADFKGLEKKKRVTLESWEKSDYLDLSYSLKSRVLTEDTVKIQVEWVIKTTQSATGQLEEGQLLLEVLLKK